MICRERNFKAAAERWNFDRPFSDLIRLAECDHDRLEEIGNRLIGEDRTNPKGYAVIQACCVCKPKAGHYDVGWRSLLIGVELVNGGKLEEGTAFFLSLCKIFPALYEPYAILYGIICEKQKAYRASPVRIRAGQKKTLILSFTVWGDQYVRLFSDYCIPSMMAAGNLPAVAAIRDISFDIYAHPKDIAVLKAHEMFPVLSGCCEVNFIEFPERLVTCEGYKGNDHFRYNIYGGFHHLSIEKARSVGADIICLGPDNVFSDGCFLSYVKYIDQGYEAVLSGSTRAQAEVLVPVLDGMKDPRTKILSITADELVELSTQYVHNTFMQYVVTDDRLPKCRLSFFVIPHKHGLTMRSEHYHSAILSSAAIDRSKDIVWRYTTLDDMFVVATLFPHEKDREKLKIITDSKDGIMLDITYGSPGGSVGLWHEEKEEGAEKYSEAYLDEVTGKLNDQQLWTFMFTMNYNMEKELRGVRAYLRDKDGSLRPKEFPLTEEIENVQKLIDGWCEKRISQRQDPARRRLSNG